MATSIVGTKNWNFIRGDDWKIEFAFHGIDMSGATFKIQVKLNGVLKLDSTTAGVLTKTYADSKTVMRWKVPYSATEVLSPTTYTYDVQVTDTSNVRRTYIKGVINIEKDTTT